MILLLNSIAHFLVDGLCAAVIFGQIAEERSLLILLYNTLAFSTQCLVGYIADRMRSVRRMEAISVILLVLGFALPVHGLLKILLIGAGNSGFHVAGGVMTLRESEGKAGRLGVFVAPGAAGLTLGTLYPGLGTAFAAALLAAAAVIYKIAGDEYDVKEQERIPDISITLLLTAAVAVRAIGGTAVRFPWNSGAADSLIMTMFVVAGKMNFLAYCFRAKCYYGMRDNAELPETTRNPMGEANLTPKQLQERYLQGMRESDYEDKTVK